MGKEALPLQQQYGNNKKALDHLDNILKSNGQNLFSGRLDRARNNGTFLQEFDAVGKKRWELLRRINGKVRPQMFHKRKLLEQQLISSPSIEDRFFLYRESGVISESEYEEALPNNNEQPHHLPASEETTGNNAHLTKKERQFIEFLGTQGDVHITTRRAITFLYPKDIESVDYAMLKGRFSVFLSTLRKKEAAPEITTTKGGKKTDESTYSLRNGASSTPTLPNTPPQEAGFLPSFKDGRRRPEGDTSGTRVAPALPPDKTADIIKKPQIGVKRFMEERLTDIERKVYAVLLTNPTLTKHNITTEIYGKKGANASRLATVNMALHSLGEKLAQHRGEELTTDDPKRKLGEQRVSLISDTPGGLRASPPVVEPRKPIVVFEGVYSRRHMSAERFDEIQYNLKVDLARVILTRLDNLGAINRRDDRMGDDPMLLLNTTSVSPANLKNFFNELHGVLDTKKILVEYAMEGVTDFWNRSGDNMLGKPNKEQELYGVTQALKRRRMRLYDIAFQLYGHFGLPIPRRYTDKERA